jgi:chaperonin GroEL
MKDVIQAAHQIIFAALRAPLKAIVSNSGESFEAISNRLLSRKIKEKDNWLGFNALTNEIGDLKEAGIIDPLKVTKTALLNAVSVAANYLMVGAAVTEIPEKKDSGGGGMPGGMGGMDY